LTPIEQTLLKSVEIGEEIKVHSVACRDAADFFGSVDLTAEEVLSGR
jgi:hypothetical protein